jgi:hypothetical protein
VSHSTEQPELTKAERLPIPTLWVTAVLLAFGLALIFQSDRWTKTPAYGNLLSVFSADTWGYIYVGGAVLMAAWLAWRKTRPISVAAHAVAFALFMGWEFGFDVRYITDKSTTIANVIAWLTYAGLVLWSGQLVDRHDKR